MFGLCRSISMSSGDNCYACPLKAGRDKGIVIMPVYLSVDAQKL